MKEVGEGAWLVVSSSDVHNLNENVNAAFAIPLHSTFALSSFSSVCVFIPTECTMHVCMGVLVSVCVRVLRLEAGQKSCQQQDIKGG